MPLIHEPDGGIGLPDGSQVEEGEGNSGGTGGVGKGNTSSTTIFAPIIIHGLRTSEPNFAYFLVEWGPDEDGTDNIIKQIIPGKKVAGELAWEGFPLLLTNTILGDWYKFRISVVNKFGWKSATEPVSEEWVYQRAGLDVDDYVRIDEIVNILPNSDFQFDLLENGTYDLPYWEYWTGAAWERPLDGDGHANKGLYGRLTDYNLILKAGNKLRSSAITMYEDRPYALSGYFLQDFSGAANLTFRVAYYDVSDNLLEFDYVLMGENGIRVFNSSTWPGGGVFEERDRVGAVFFPPRDVSYGRVEILNDGTSDIWADDLMLSQTNRITKYVSWDRESIESWEDTWQYRRNIAPNGTVDFNSITPIQAYGNEDGSVDIKLRWNWTESNRKASGFVVLGNLASSGVYSASPTLADHDFAYKLANAASRKFDLVGVNPLNRYSFAIAPYATVASGIAYADLSYYDSGVNNPSSPDNNDWIDFQAATVIDLMSAPRTQVDIIAESDTEITLEFDVTSSNGEDTTTYYRLTATGGFTAVPEIGGVPTLAVTRDTKDVVVYYYSQGNTTGRAESVLEFVIDKNRVPQILSTDSEYDRTTKQGIVYWWGDDDVERVDYDINDGPTFIVSGTSGNTGWFSILPGEVKRVDMVPRGRGEVGATVSETIAAAPEVPRVELHITSRTSTAIGLEYEVEGFGDDTVNVYSRKGDSGSFSLVTGSPPSQSISRDTKDINLYYYASGTTTGLLTTTYTFLIDVNRVPEIVYSAIDLNPISNTYIAKWGTDDDTDYVEYSIDGGLTYIVSGQAGQTSSQSISPGERQEVLLTPYGPTGSGVSHNLYAFLSEGADEPPHIVISGTTSGTDGGGAYLLVDVYSYVGSGLSGSVEYAEGNSAFSDAGTSYYQHKVYRPVTGDKFSKYRAHLGVMYSDTVIFNIDQDDLPEIRARISLSEDQQYVEIGWDGDDDVASLEIIPSGAASRYYNLQSGEDQTDTIDAGTTANYELIPYNAVDKGGKAGKTYPLSVFRPKQEAPWVSISKYSENTSATPATITLKFDATTGASIYYTTSNDKKPGDAGWTSVSNGGTVAFNRSNTGTTVVRAYAYIGTTYSVVASFTIDPDEIPSVTDLWFSPNYVSQQATLYWSVDDDADYVQLYKNGSALGSPIAVSTTQTTVTGIVKGSTYVYTAVPIRNSTEFPQNGKTVTINLTEGGIGIKSVKLTWIPTVDGSGNACYQARFDYILVSDEVGGLQFTLQYTGPTGPGTNNYYVNVSGTTGGSYTAPLYFGTTVAGSVIQPDSEFYVTPYETYPSSGYMGEDVTISVESVSTTGSGSKITDGSTVYYGASIYAGEGLNATTHTDGTPKLKLKYTISTSDPSGTPADGELWFKVDP